MLSRRADTLLALSVAMLVAAVAGVQLGRSAVAEIDPIHFRGAAPPPRAIDPVADRPPADRYLAAYGWDEGYAARDSDCGGDCDAREARQALVRAIAPAPVTAAAAAEPATWRPAAPAGRGLSVEPYMHYPIEDEPVEDGAAAKVSADEAGAD